MSPGPGTTPARRVNANGKVTRQEIIRAATALFAEVGFHAASLRDIAARATMSHPGLLHHFPTKEALLAAVLEDRDEADGAVIAQEVAHGRSVLEALVRLVERNQVRRPIVELYATLSAEATSPEHPAHAYFVRRYAATTAMLTEQLQRYADAGRLRGAGAPDRAARTVIAVMDGLQVQWLLSLGGAEDQRIDMVADLRAHLATVIEGAL